MHRRTFLCGLTLGTLAGLCAAQGQQAGTVPRVGVLSSRPERSRPFEAALGELGWLENKSVTFERRFTIDYQELPRLAHELVRASVDVMFSIYGVQAVMEATQTIPIVAVAADPVRTGFVPSLARPGGNVTGLSIQGTDLSGKRLEILTQALPKARRIAVLANPATPSTKPNFDETQARATALGVQLLRFETSDVNQAPAVLGEAARQGAQALVVLSDPMFSRYSDRLVEAVAQRRLPAMWEWRHFVEAGGLMSYGPRLDELARRAATFVDKILKGAKPGDLPIEQATSFELVINMRTARALRLTIPPALLLRADPVTD